MNTQEKIQIVSETEFQKICGEFVAQEVLCNLNEEVEYILKKSWEDREAPYSFDDMENFYIFNVETLNSKDILPTSWDCQYLEGLEGYNEEMTQSYLNEYKERIENIKGWIEDKQQENENDENISEVTQERNAEMLINALEKIQEHIDYLDNLENEPQEIYEYWAVTGWLGDKLAEKGHPVIKNSYGKSIWGRCTTGQAILLDGVIRELVNEYRQVKTNNQYS